MLRFGVIGLGDIAVSEHLPALERNKKAVIQGISTRNIERLEEIKQKYNVPFATTDYRELLAREDIDAVIIATPPWVTPGITIEALNAGKNVLCEKPVAMTIEEALKMKEAQKITGKKLMVGMCHHNDVILERMHKWLSEGRIGSPVMLRVSIYDEKWDPEENPEHYERIFNTLKYGSPSIHEGPHIFDWLHVLTGQEIKTLTAYGYRARPEFPDSNYDITMLEYENGDVGKVEIGWFLKKFPGYTFEAVGSKGIISMNSYDRSAKMVLDNETEEYFETSGRDWLTHDFDRQTERFINTVLNDLETDPDIDDAIYTMRVTDAIRESMKTHKPAEVK